MTVTTDLHVHIPKSDKDLKQQAVTIEQLRGQLDNANGADAARRLVQGGELSRPEDMLEDAYLRRWLRARRWDVVAAAKSITAHAAWRATMMPTGRILASDIPNELSGAKSFMLGCDKRGRSTVLFQVRKHNAWTRKLEELQRYCCYLLDKAISSCDYATNPHGRITVLLDLTDMGTVNLDVPAVKALFGLLGDHYVERLGQMVLYNPPFIFWGVWNTLSGLLPAVTLKKILVVSPKDQASMIEAVGADVLPTEYGGTANMVEPVSEAC